jgi:acyl-CoA reductase-like NAD-dependent aldehyde dehydrogenase
MLTDLKLTKIHEAHVEHGRNLGHSDEAIEAYLLKNFPELSEVDIKFAVTQHHRGRSLRQMADTIRKTRKKLSELEAEWQNMKNEFSDLD